MSSRDNDQNGLGAFLRARRYELSPSEVDLPEGGTQRRVADQRIYMNVLAGTPAKSRRRAPQKVKPYLRRVLDRIDAPAIVTTPTHHVLAWNLSS